MRLLMVDDERYVLRNIRKVIEQSGLAIDEILTACNAEEARRLLQAAAVDVLICDIEMPQESGLELLVWVVKACPETQSIVLTCHADFNYIRDAMRLNVLDYLVKPVQPDELIATVQKALDARHAASELRETLNYGRFWRENPAKLQESFWSDVILGRVPAARMADEASRRNIAFALERQVFPILLLLYSKIGAAATTVTDVRKSIGDIARNRFSQFAPDSVVVDQGDDALLCVLPVPSGIANWTEYRAAVLRECEALINSAETYLSCRLFCYISKGYAASGVSEACAALKSYADNDVIKKERVCFIFDTNALVGSSRAPNLNILAVLLMEGSYGRAKQETIELLDNPKADRAYLHTFYQRFLQAFSSVLEHDHITYEALIGEDESLRTLALDSVQELQEGILRLIDRLAETMGQTTAVAEVKRYIDTHLDGKLTREQLARQVFLSPDHLNRIFKQENGLAIHEYIIDRRMELAKELIASTDLKLSAISMNVGYVNFSQFSKLFRAKTGMSPKEYRRRGAGYPPARGFRPSKNENTPHNP